MSIKFSEDQELVLGKIETWKQNKPKQTLTLGGFGGTGKTTIIAYLANTWAGTATAAFCGKAANVLRNKGIAATTIHGLIYEPYDDGVTVRFRKKKRLDGVVTIIIDEASMVNTPIYEDLLSFRKPILFVGDHGQLEPIGDNPNLMKEPELRLERIHRQAQDNPILRLATAFREGRPVPDWQDPKGRLSILPRLDFDAALEANPGAQVICGFNNTRHDTNRTIRARRKFTDVMPQPGELLICLRNNRIFNIFNGQQATCTGRGRDAGGIIELDMATEDGRRFRVPCLKRQFGVNLIDEHRGNDVALYDFGYCLTAHKSQGSEFDSVVVKEEISSNWNAPRWRYTVGTRAQEKLIYCR